MNVPTMFFAAEQVAITAYGVERLRHWLCSERNVRAGRSYESQSRERMELARTTTDLLALSEAPVRHERDREIANHEHATRLAAALRARADAECERALAEMRLAAVMEPDEELRAAQRQLELILAEKRIAAAREAVAAPTNRRMRGRREVRPDNYHYAEHDENRHCSSIPPCEPI